MRSRRTRDRLSLVELTELQMGPGERRGGVTPRRQYGRWVRHAVERRCESACCLPVASHRVERQRHLTHSSDVPPRGGSLLVDATEGSSAEIERRLRITG